LIAVDTSIVVAALVEAHEAHESARSVLAERPALPAHAAIESFSVLTRLPAPMRVRPGIAVDLLEKTFPVIIPLPETEQLGAVRLLASFGIAGGRVYDGLIALTALRADAELLSRDRHAKATYEALGVRVKWIH